MQTNKDFRDGREREAMRELDELPVDSIVDIDPEDPSQLLDDASQYSGVHLDLEAQPSAEAAADLDVALADSAGEAGAVDALDDFDDDVTSEVEEDATDLDTPSQTTTDAYANGGDDTGELYGVHVPPIADGDLDVTADGESFEDSELGEHVFETLEKKAAEIGAEPERVVDVVDNSDGDRRHSSRDRRDRPVADKGSGGPAGV
jgi:hypothetical protein